MASCIDTAMSCCSGDILQAFDELLLLKPGGRVIFNGALGQDQANLISHFQSVKGVSQ